MNGKRKIEDYDEFVKKLETKYPKMFSNPIGGISVGPGWWNIIETLCHQIYTHVEWAQNQKEKYNRGDGCLDVTISQIKEKFGGLRFYYSGGDGTVDGMVRMAEAWADQTCEECGNPGRRRNGGWIKTLCDDHEAERQQRYKERNQE